MTKETLALTDADVEDNLESDTSRCYKSLSDSMMQSLDSPEKSVARVSDAGTPETVNSPAGVKTFNVQTNIENHIENANPSPGNGNATKNSVNGQVDGGDHNVDSTGLSVTYTFTNGCLAENPNVEYNVEKCVDTNVSFLCSTNTNRQGGTTLCNGDLSKHNDAESDSKHEDCIVDYGLVKGDPSTNSVKDNSKLVNGDIDDSSKTHEDVKDNVKEEEGVANIPNGKVTPDPQMETSLTDLTSEISTLSLGDSTGTLASDLSRMTMKDEEVREVVNGNRPNSGHFSGACIPNGDIGDMSSSMQCKNSPISSSVHMSKQNRFKDLQREGKKKSINTLSERYVCVLVPCASNYW